MKRILNLEYAGLQGTYWMISCAIQNFASAFLLARDYSNTDIGVILAITNILAVILQPLLADVADRSRKISLLGVLKLSAVSMMVLILGLFLFQKKSMSLTISYILLASIFVALQPILNSLVFKLGESGVEMNFGAGRAAGSLIFAVVCSIVGLIVEQRGTGVLPSAGMISIVLFLLLLILTGIHFRRACSTCKMEPAGAAYAGGQDSETSEEEEEINLIQFAARNKMFFLLTVGVMGVFYANGTLNSYMLQIITPLGGGSGDMGLVFAVLAALEIPTMVFFVRINRRFSCQTLLKTACAAYLIKIAVTWAADSMAAIYLSQLLQTVSFALFLPAMVEFVHQIMRKGEAVKGQALYMAMVTVSTVLSSLIGGAALDWGGSKLLLMVATMFTAVGTLIVFLTVDRIGTDEE